MQATLVATGFTKPVAFVPHPTDAAVQIVVQQGGLARVLVNGVVQAQPFLDLRGLISSDGEKGLLGLAFAPDYATSGRVFVYFINPDGHSVVARYTRSAAQPLRLDPATRVDLVWPSGERFIRQPFANHKGGHLAFGPDGFLYIGLGDGGSGNDPLNHAQNPRSLLGKMLRIDVAVSEGHATGYVVPATNPFAGRSDVLGEIWAFGLRNPWRWSFDDPARGGTGALIIGDVGQGAWEEIDYEPAGAGGRNYGWRNREGAHDNVTTTPPFSPAIVDPIHEYGRGTGQTVIGGYVYRGTALASLLGGRYVFADIGSGRLWSLGLQIHATNEATVTDVQEHTNMPGAGVRPWVSFGTDARGELYGLTYDGSLFRFDPYPSSTGRRGDFDGDAKADVSIYRPNTGTWHILSSASGYASGATYAWGVATDVPVTGDYDGDGLADLAVYRPGNGYWYVLKSSTGFSGWAFYTWGMPGDVPVPADYDGDGRTDITVYRPSNGYWYVLTSRSAFTSAAFYSWGMPGDLPAPGDYDGDELVDITVYRPSTGHWFILRSSSGYSAASIYAWGRAGDLPVAGDYDGDGRADVAVYRPDGGYWFILTSASGFSTSRFFSWGAPNDRPVPADYDGDGIDDIAVYRSSNGGWYVLKSSAGFTASAAYLWGQPADVPILAGR